MTHEAESGSVMRVAYYVTLRDGRWMIERHGQYYGPFACREDAVKEAVYVAEYSIRHGLEAEVVVQRIEPSANGSNKPVPASARGQSLPQRKKPSPRIVRKVVETVLQVGQGEMIGADLIRKLFPQQGS
jgi:hypothetical protein